MIAKQNCWEFNKCGREPGGSRVGETGACPAATETSCTGLNNGKNGGRMCWAISGTFSTGRIKGAFAREFSCLNCDFLRSVCKEEDICSFEQLTPYRIYYDRSRMFGRRNFMRIDAHLDLTLKPKKDVLYIVGVTINFSSDGFSFISEYFELKSNEPEEFRITLPDKDKYVCVLGDIAWKTRVRDRCLVGVKIRYLEEEIKREILDYSYNKWIEGVRLQ